MEKNAFDRTQHHIKIKVVENFGVCGIYLNIVKMIYEKPVGKIMLNGGEKN